MCGILCQYPNSSGNYFSKESLIKSLSDLSHRGPDASNYYFKNGTFLGHNRLSIVDLDERSNQPFFFENYVIVFNGEIFNFKEIRETLIKRGKTFITSSDTEVLLVAFIEFGYDVYDMLNGFWAFIIYDIDEDRLHISRDRFGQKPLFFRKNEAGYIFSSEVAPLFNLDRTGLNLKAIAKFLYSSYDYDMDTFFEDIFSIEPSCHYVFTKGEILEKYRYWQYPNKNDLAYDASIFNELLSDAVMIRKSSDVGFALAVSSGLDSNLIQSILSINRKADHDQFTAYCYKDSNIIYDELPGAKAITKALGNSLTPINLDHSFIEFRINLSQIVRNAGKGFASKAIISYDAMLRKVNQDGYRVLIEGQGADEILGGYELLNYSNFIWYFFNKGEFLNVWKLAIKLIRSPGGFTLKTLNLLRFNLPFFLYKIINKKSKYFKSSYIFRPSIDTKSIAHEDSINRFLIFQHKCILHELLFYGDIISMKNSVESRSPFLDHRLVEYLFRTDSKPKYNAVKGFKAAIKESPYLKSIEDLLSTKKLGFNTSFSSEIIKEILGEIKNSEIIDLGIFRKSKLIRYIDKCILMNEQNVMFDMAFLFKIYQVHLFIEVFKFKKI
jgi:asparagine synthase (glutamine-hydrolysing)